APVGADASSARADDRGPSVPPPIHDAALGAQDGDDRTILHDRAGAARQDDRTPPHAGDDVEAWARESRDDLAIRSVSNSLAVSVDSVLGNGHSHSLSLSV